MRIPIYWNCPIISLCVNYPRFTYEQMKEQVERIYHVTYDQPLDIAFSSKIIHINGDKKFMHGIPYLVSMYQRYLDVALSYSRGRTS